MIGAPFPCAITSPMASLLRSRSRGDPPSRPRTPALTIQMPDVFVISPDGEGSFCAFDSGVRRAPTSPLLRPPEAADDTSPVSPSAPNFAELDKALRFLEERPGSSLSRRLQQDAVNDSARDIGDAQSDSLDTMVGSEDGVDAPSALKEPAVGSESSRRSVVLKVDTAAPAARESGQTSRSSKFGTTRSKSKMFFPSMFFGDKKSAERAPQTPPTTPPATRSERPRKNSSSIFWWTKKPPAAKPSKVETEIRAANLDTSIDDVPRLESPHRNSLRRRPFSVISFRRTISKIETEKASSPKAPSLPPDSPRSMSPSLPSPATPTSPSSTISEDKVLPFTLMTKPLSSQARLDSFHFDNTTPLFDPLTFTC